MLYPRLFGMPTLRSIHPFEELSRLRGQMDRMMDNFYGRAMPTLSANVFPAINVTETENYFVVRAELPGVQANDLDIQITANNLTISGERKLTSEDESAKYHRREREGGRFSRAFTLPREVDSGKVEARLVNGMLTLRLPKTESAKPRRIAIGN